jgi:mannose-6-phosphate isomerase-like protein (cupin superfamily)
MHVGDSSAEIRPGSAVYIPSGVEHSVENTGEEEIKLVFVFSPPVVSGSYADIVYDKAVL